MFVIIRSRILLTDFCIYGCKSSNTFISILGYLSINLSFAAAIGVNEIIQMQRRRTVGVSRDSEARGIRNFWLPNLVRKAISRSRSKTVKGASFGGKDESCCAQFGNIPAIVEQELGGPTLLLGTSSLWSYASRIASLYG